MKVDAEKLYDALRELGRGWIPRDVHVKALRECFLEEPVRIFCLYCSSQVKDVHRPGCEAPAEGTFKAPPKAEKCECGHSESAHYQTKDGKRVCAYCGTTRTACKRPRVPQGEGAETAMYAVCECRHVDMAHQKDVGACIEYVDGKRCGCKAFRLSREPSQAETIRALRAQIEEKDKRTETLTRLLNEVQSERFNGAETIRAKDAEIAKHVKVLRDLNALYESNKIDLDEAGKKLSYAMGPGEPKHSTNYLAAQIVKALAEVRLKWDDAVSEITRKDAEIQRLSVARQTWEDSSETYRKDVARLTKERDDYRADRDAWGRKAEVLTKERDEALEMGETWRKAQLATAGDAARISHELTSAQEMAAEGVRMFNLVSDELSAARAEIQKLTEERDKACNLLADSTALDGVKVYVGPTESAELIRKLQLALAEAQGERDAARQGLAEALGLNGGASTLADLVTFIVNELNAARNECDELKVRLGT